jgi:hypothetical protein
MLSNSKSPITGKSQDLKQSWSLTIVSRDVLHL